jgi:hypothetical protein
MTGGQAGECKALFVRQGQENRHKPKAGAKLNVNHLDKPEHTLLMSELLIYLRLHVGQMWEWMRAQVSMHGGGQWMLSVPRSYVPYFMRRTSCGTCMPAFFTDNGRV